MTATSRYIGLLRGINVSGQRSVRMEDLRSLFEKLGYSDVSSYIQSGNIFFSASPKSDDTSMAQTIEKAITTQFSFDVPVIIRSQEEMKHILAENPLLKEKGIQSEYLHVTFLQDGPSRQKISAISTLDFNPDKFVIAGREAYLYCPGGYGRTKINNTFFENRLKVKTTTRNWKTVIKLVELSEL